jgi:hypothetical protein
MRRPLENHSSKCAIIPWRSTLDHLSIRVYKRGQYMHRWPDRVIMKWHALLVLTRVVRAA